MPFCEKNNKLQGCAMSNHHKTIVKAHKKEIARSKDIRLRKHLNADALFAAMRTSFAKNEDHRPGNVQVSLADALMSIFAVFSLKDASFSEFITPFRLSKGWGPPQYLGVLCFALFVRRSKSGW